MDFAHRPDGRQPAPASSSRLAGGGPHGSPTSGRLTRACGRPETGNPAAENTVGGRRYSPSQQRIRP
jgi:hypothetical protein